jgi:hypothetical protein
LPPLVRAVATSSVKGIGLFPQSGDLVFPKSVDSFQCLVHNEDDGGPTEFWKFHRKMILEKYEAIVKGFGMG